MIATEWNKAEGVACRHCGQKVLRLADGLCAACSDQETMDAVEGLKDCAHCKGTGKVPGSPQDKHRRKAQEWCESFDRALVEFNIFNGTVVRGVALAGFHNGGWPAVRVFYGRQNDADLPNPWPRYWQRDVDERGYCYQDFGWGYGRDELKRISLNGDVRLRELARAFSVGSKDSESRS